MKHLQIYERFQLQGAHPISAIQRLRKLGADRAFYGLKMMYYWFAGRMMAVEDEMKDVMDIFRDIGEMYDDGNPGQYLYRAVHIHLDRPGMTEDEILAIEKSQTGPKQLQSWASSIKGAEWFFDRFVKGQNERHHPVQKAAWVIVRVDSKDVEKLIHFEECLQFFADCDAVNLSDDAEHMIKWLYIDDMLKLHEFICLTPKECPIKVMKVLVAPGGEEEGTHSSHRRQAA